MRSRTLAIVGGGSIGRSFAILFAKAGFAVQLFEPDTARRSRLHDDIALTCADLREFGLLEVDEPTMRARIQVFDAIADAVDGAALVQECAPEDVALKRELFADLERIEAGEGFLQCPPLYEFIATRR